MYKSYLIKKSLGKYSYKNYFILKIQIKCVS